MPGDKDRLTRSLHIDISNTFRSRQHALKPSARVMQADSLRKAAASVSDQQHTFSRVVGMVSQWPHQHHISRGKFSSRGDGGGKYSVFFSFFS